MIKRAKELGFNYDLVVKNPGVPNFSFVQKIIPRNLPEIFIVGAQKAGTTSLYAWLTQHSRIQKSKKKETFFFNDSNNFRKGMGWYKCHFPVLFPFTTSKRTCDASANYFESIEAPARMIKEFPNAKVIILLRNPVDRAFSHYQMAVSRGFELLSFEESLELEQERISFGEELNEEVGHNYVFQKLAYRTKGIYVNFLMHWLNHFPSDQLMIVNSEELFINPDVKFGEIVNYVGLNNNNKILHEVYNSQEYTEMNSATRRSLEAFYFVHNMQLEKMLNRSFNWDSV